jgi:hypothetical protein
MSRRQVVAAGGGAAGFFAAIACAEASPEGKITVLEKSPQSRGIPHRYRQSRQTAAADWRSFSGVQAVWSGWGTEPPGQATRNVSS